MPVHSFFVQVNENIKVKQCSWIDSTNKCFYQTTKCMKSNSYRKHYETVVSKAFVINRLKFAK